MNESVLCYVERNKRIDARWLWRKKKGKRTTVYVVWSVKQKLMQSNKQKLRQSNENRWLIVLCWRNRNKLIHNKWDKALMVIPEQKHSLWEFWNQSYALPWLPVLSLCIPIVLLPFWIFLVFLLIRDPWLFMHSCYQLQLNVRISLIDEIWFNCQWLVKFCSDDIIDYCYHSTDS